MLRSSANCRLLAPPAEIPSQSLSGLAIIPVKEPHRGEPANWNVSETHLLYTSIYTLLKKNPARLSKQSVKKRVIFSSPMERQNVGLWLGRKKPKNPLILAFLKPKKCGNKHQLCKPHCLIHS